MLKKITGLAALLAVCYTQNPAALAAQFTEQTTASADGTEIAYVEGGAGAATLVFVHGWTCDRSYWAAQLPVFAGDYRVIAVDLAGHGASALGREHYSMASFGADVAAAVTDAGAQRVILVGHSMGGPVILEAARLLGDRLVGLVAADTLKLVRMSPVSEATLEALSAPLEADYPAVAEPIIRGLFVDSSDPALVESVVSDMLATDHFVGVDANRGMMKADVAGGLQDLSVPLVVINSDYAPTDTAALKALHADTRVEIMSGVGHFVMQEDPQTFNRLLRAAVESILAPGA